MGIHTTGSNAVDWETRVDMPVCARNDSPSSRRAGASTWVVVDF